MPREVDTGKRLADIADATVRVALTSGAQAVTIRSVARELGGSTTLVTNYLPSRAALIMNALDRARDRWRDERDQAVAEVPAPGRLAAMLEWSLTSADDDAVMRTLILEIVANAAVEPELRESLHRESVEFQSALTSAATDAGYADPARVAKLAYLMLRGAYIATTEDPDHWDEAQVREVIVDAVAGLPRIAGRHGRAVHDDPAA
ncbi:MAG: TetR/AcrR family transcriptional regulator [Microbacteriaceae bacterium]|nr:TetR/AcrR family transcriptional regulator [Microbacteriaceae bacterium]